MVKRTTPNQPFTWNARNDSTTPMAKLPTTGTRPETKIKSASAGAWGMPTTSRIGKVSTALAAATTHWNCTVTIIASATYSSQRSIVPRIERGSIEARKRLSSSSSSTKTIARMKPISA
jgi:hypothetical protein